MRLTWVRNASTYCNAYLYACMIACCWAVPLVPWTFWGCPQCRRLPICHVHIRDSSHCGQPGKYASARRSRACLPCAWIFGLAPAYAWLHSGQEPQHAFWGRFMLLTQPPISAVDALCLYSWPAVSLSALDWQSATDTMNVSQQLSS